MTLPGPIVSTDIPDGYVNAVLFWTKAWTKVNALIAAVGSQFSKVAAVSVASGALPSGQLLEIYGDVVVTCVGGNGAITFPGGGFPTVQTTILMNSGDGACRIDCTQTAFRTTTGAAFFATGIPTPGTGYTGVMRCSYIAKGA